MILDMEVHSIAAALIAIIIEVNALIIMRAIPVLPDV
jgi:hypothetical protein